LGKNVARIYYGWFIVGLAILANMVVYGATHSAFSLYILPVSTEYNLSRANMNTALILLNVGLATLAPPLGRLLDHFPAKPVMLACTALLGLSLASLGLSRSLWLSAGVIAVPLAVGVLGCASLTMSVLTVRWFVRQRGRAMALTALGVSLGSMVVAPVQGLLIESYGWRHALLIMAAAVTVVLLVLVLAIRERPGPGDVEGGQTPALDSAPSVHPAATPLKLADLVRMPYLWLLALGSGVAAGVIQSLTISLVPLARGDGLTTIEATSLISIVGAAALVSKLVLAAVADRIQKATLLTGLFASGACLNAALLMLSHSYALLIGCAMLIGALAATFGPLVFTLVADRVGAASFGSARGLLGLIAGVFSIVAVRFSGEVFDRTGSYNVMFATFIVAQLLAASLVFFTRSARPSAVLQARA
jgi:sugar phosphate permease